jgi:hypothetical protein
MAYVRDAAVADAPGIAAVWWAGLFAAYPGIIAVDIIEGCLADGDLENADPGDFGGLDASDAGLQTALTVLAVLAGDLSDVAEADGDAERTRRSSSSVEMTTIFPPREWRSPSRRRTRSRTT